MMKWRAMKEKSLPAPWYDMVHSEGFSGKDESGAANAPTLSDDYFFLA